MSAVQERTEETRPNPLRHALRRRMVRPQRHRLLQGYPMAPLLSPVAPGFDPFRGLDLTTSARSSWACCLTRSATPG